MTWLNLRSQSYTFKCSMYIIYSMFYRVLVSNFTEEQLDRYEMYRRSAFPKASIKRVIKDFALSIFIFLNSCRFLFYISQLY
jgi:hypothetical protein